jgi:hypothetical protein
MRLISNFKDYYDGVVFSTFTEKHVSWVRNTEQVEGHGAPDAVSKILSDSGLWFSQSYIFGANRHYDPQGYIILGFCGEIFPMYGWYIDEYRENPGFHIHHRPGEVSPTKSPSGGLLPNSYKALQDSKYLKNLFLELKTPVFLIGSSPILTRGSYPRLRGDLQVGLYKSPNLSELGFAKLMDPYTAAQKIEIYLGNELAQVNSPDMPVGGDVILARSKGYDKWSFRNKPKK